MKPPPPVTTYLAIEETSDNVLANALPLMKWQADYKPNSVPQPRGRGSDHSSRPQVSLRLEQPTRKLRRAAADARTRRVSLFGLAPCGVCQADPLPDRWCALTAPFHPYRGFGDNSSYEELSPKPRRYIFCGTFRPLRALELRGTLPCGVRTFLGFRRDRPSACQSYDFILSSNFCNSLGSAEWNSIGFPVIG